MKYIMCAKTFPAYHPRAGQPTGFRESILAGRKIHTLRQAKGNRKTGDYVSLREWEGKPYASKQIEFAGCQIRVCPIVVNVGMWPTRLRGLARDDGFESVDDFRYWFTMGKDVPIDFTGFCIWFENVIATVQE